MTLHKTSHPLAGMTVRLNDRTAKGDGVFPDAIYRIEDYWDKLTGESWMFAEGNPAALNYAMRSGLGEMPLDDEVVYGKIGAFGHLIHVSELGEIVNDDN